MIEVKLKTDKVKATKYNYNNESSILVEPSSLKHMYSSSICVNISDMPEIYFGDNSWNRLRIYDNGNIYLDHILSDERVLLSINPDMYYIEIDAKERDDIDWLNMTATIKRKDN